MTDTDYEDINPDDLPQGLLLNNIVIFQQKRSDYTEKNFKIVYIEKEKSEEENIPNQ